jgi:hypothetical protein
MQSVRRCATLLGRGWAGTRRSKTRIDLLALAPDTDPCPFRCSSIAAILAPRRCTEFVVGVTEGSIKEQDDHRTQLRVNS